MNKLVTENIHAVRTPGGDVWISRKENTSIYYISIPKEDCAELARLLMWPIIQESHKVDYALSVDEPE